MNVEPTMCRAHPISHEGLCVTNSSAHVLSITPLLKQVTFGVSEKLFEITEKQAGFGSKA